MGMATAGRGRTHVSGLCARRRLLGGGSSRLLRLQAPAVGAVRAPARAAARLAAVARRAAAAAQAQAAAKHVQHI